MRRRTIVSLLFLICRITISDRNCFYYATVSNPPPSPVTDANREISSDYDTHEIKHVVNMVSPEKVTPEVLTVAEAADGKPMPSTSTVAYDDDFLVMNCDDMDMF